MLQLKKTLWIDVLSCFISGIDFCIHVSGFIFQETYFWTRPRTVGIIISIEKFILLYYVLTH